jgi:hypothetical protein
MDDGSQIAYVAHQVVVFHAGACDTDGVHFLKRIGSDERQRYLSRDYNDRSRIHVRVGDSGDGVGSARPRRDKRHADATRSARIAFGHVNRALFVAHQVMRDAVTCAPQLVIDVKHSATWIAED